MAIDAYAPCPCGSGKKFKWCCQAYYAQIEKAFHQQANKQHEAALRTMEELTQAHPSNPEVWGRRAELLWENDQLDAAEESLQKALAINPNYAFGYYLRGMMRHEEGEVQGALHLYRKAAELCAPDARELLADIHVSIGQCEVFENRPLAAHAAWEIAHRCLPSDTNIQELRERYFGENAPFPPIVRKAYRFLSPSPNVSPEQQDAWQRALAANETGKLADAAVAFEQLAAEYPQDAPAWFNLGLVRAWLGDNLRAIDAFDNYVARESDEDRAASAWALAETLRFAKGMLEHSDWAEYTMLYRIQDPAPLVEFLKSNEHIANVQQTEYGIVGLLMDRVMPTAHENLALFELPRVLSSFAIIGNGLLLRHHDQASLARAQLSLQPLEGTALGTPERDQTSASFQVVLDYATPVRLPEGVDSERAVHLVREVIGEAFEEKWAQRPLKSLGNICPVDAVGHAALRKKVLGLISFFEELIRSSLRLPYDFDRLRHKLGLPTASPAEGVTGGQRDIGAMNAGELASLQPDELPDQDLERAFQACQRLDARELAGKFARALAGRPPQGESSDRFALYNLLSQLALEQNETVEALDWINSGEKHDCEHNQGQRRNDFELRRAQVHLKAGEADQANEVFKGLIQRLPSNMDVIGKAAEAMLSARRSKDATAYAEQGLGVARSKGDRDRIGYFSELLEAARRL